MKLTSHLYHIYINYCDILTPYHTFSKIWTSLFPYLLKCLKTAGWLANSLDPDQMPQNVASDQGLHCFLRPVWPSTYNKYGTKKEEIISMWQCCIYMIEHSKLLNIFNLLFYGEEMVQKKDQFSMVVLRIFDWTFPIYWTFSIYCFMEKKIS